MKAQEYLRMIGRIELRNHKGNTGEFIITPEQMEEFADTFRAIEVPPEPDPTSIDAIVSAVCNSYHVDSALIRIKTRRREIVDPRQLCFALIMFSLKMPCDQVGSEMGGFDHATVLHGIQKVSDRFNTYPYYRQQVTFLIKSLFELPDKQQHIIDRIIDPHKDRKESMAKIPANGLHLACG